MSINVGAPPEGPQSPLDQWIVRSIKSIELYIQTNEIGTMVDPFNNSPAVSTKVYTLDPTAATTDDVRNVLATLIDAFRARGARNA
jgi:hypothetical protein